MRAEKKNSPASQKSAAFARKCKSGYAALKAAFKSLSAGFLGILLCRRPAARSGLVFFEARNRERNNGQIKHWWVGEVLFWGIIAISVVRAFMSCPRIRDFSALAHVYPANDVGSNGFP